MDIRYHHRSWQEDQALGLFAADVPVQFAAAAGPSGFAQSFQQARQKGLIGPSAKLRFNYQPSWENISQKVVLEDSAERLPAEAKRTHQLDFICRQQGTQYELILRYSRNFFTRKRAKRLVRLWGEKAGGELM